MIWRQSQCFIIGHAFIPSTHITWLQTDPTTFIPGAWYSNATQSAPVLEKTKNKQTNTKKTRLKKKKEQTDAELGDEDVFACGRNQWK